MSGRTPRTLLVLAAVVAAVAYAVRKATADPGGSYDPDRPEANR